MSSHLIAIGHIIFEFSLIMRTLLTIFSITYVVLLLSFSTEVGFVSFASKQNYNFKRLTTIVILKLKIIWRRCRRHDQGWSVRPYNNIWMINPFLWTVLLILSSFDSRFVIETRFHKFFARVRYCDY